MWWCRKTNLKKSFHNSPNTINELSHGDRIARSGLITKWDLPLELLITRPLMLMVNEFELSKRPQPYKGHSTYDNTDVCGRLSTQWGVACRVSQKNTALTINTCPKGNSDSPVLVFEKDGHLQLRRFDMPSYIDGRTRVPHRLRDHRTPMHDAAVKQPTIWRVGKQNGNMGRNRMDKEAIILPLSVVQCRIRGNRGALQ